MKEKYAEQDEEDRERMEKRIGHSFASKKELMEKCVLVYCLMPMTLKKLKR